MKLKCDTVHFHPPHSDEEASDPDHMWVKDCGQSVFQCEWSLRRRVVLSWAFPKKKQEEKPQRQRATHSVYPAVKQRGINLSVSTGEEDTRWTSWMCVTGTHGQRELKSGAFEIQLLRQKGNFCLNTAAITLENEGFPLPFDLSKLISFSCVKKRKKTANNAQMHCRMRHLLMTFEIRHA